MTTQYIDRPPRIQPELPIETIEIPPPPDKDSGRGLPVRQIILPLITILGYVLLSATGQGRNLALMIPMGISVVGTVIFAYYSYNQEKQEMEDLEAAYNKRLKDMRRQMHVSQHMQRYYYRYNNPDPLTTVRMATGDEQSRAGSRLWERRPDDVDFGHIRVGIGTRPSTVTYKAEQSNENKEDPQQDEAERIAEESRFVDDVPITIPLRSFVPPEESGGGEGDSKDDAPAKKVVQGRHSIGVAGDNAAKVADFTRALLVNYTALHSPVDSRLYVCGPPKSDRRWEWAIWLPHTNSRTESYVGDQMCFDPEAVDEFWDNLLVELDNRRQRLQDKEGGDVTIPHLLLVVDKLDPVDSDSPFAEPEAEEAVSIIMREGLQLGASVIFLVPQASKVPSDCQAVVEIEPIGAEVAFRYAETGLNTERYIGTADTLDPVRAENMFARQIKDLGVRRGFGEDLTTYVTLTDMLNVSKVDEIPIADHWSRYGTPEGAEWLRGPIGVMGANKIRRLALSADEDGVHGMIAGTTGSGKSELLLTMIAALALRYPPTVLNFVLVDYKGGSAFEPFRPLPHVVDIATNLEGNAVERMFIAIKAELDRRGKILKDHNVKHIVEYRKRGYQHEKPFPHLFVIVDEFAEMVAENPEYKARFDSITRLGRAIGVSLILATQRPTGAVTDQMRANMKFKICLRVETPDDSRELLRRSDAAYLPSNVPGRAYIQVGNEGLTLMQVARTGGPYTADEPVNLDDVIWLDEIDQTNGRDPATSGNGKEPDLKAAPEPDGQEIEADGNPGDGAAAGTGREEDDGDGTGAGNPEGGPPAAENPSVGAGDGQAVPASATRGTAAPLTVGLRARDPSTPKKYTAQEIADAINQPAETLVDWVVGAASITADQEGIPEQSKPWPDPLPVFLPLNLPIAAGYLNTARPHDGNLTLCPQLAEWLEGEGEWPGTDWRKDPLEVDIGIVDNPYHSEQRILTIDLKAGPLVLFGAPGWGKTTFLRTLMTALAAIHSPEELQMYALDFGKGALSSVRALPHLGASIDVTEEARVERLLRMLANTIDQRRNKVMKYGSLVSYNAENPDEILPVILVVVDNFGEFKENYEDKVPTLISLVRDGRAFGINFAITASQTGDVPGKLYNLFTERISLKLPDPTDYTAIVGRGAPNFNDVPGRGVVSVNRTPLEFQTALPMTEYIDDPEASFDEGVVYEEIAQAMALGWEDDTPEPVEILPELLLLEDLLDEVGEEPTRAEAIIGLNDLDRQPTRVALERQGPHFVLSGPPLSGKTTALRSWILSQALHYSPDDLAFILVDPRKGLFEYGGKHSLAEIPHVLMVASETEEVEEVTQRLRAEYDEEWIERIQAQDADKWVDLDRNLILMIDSYGEFDDISNYDITSTLGGLARTYGSEGFHVVISGQLSAMRSRDDLSKQVQSARYSLILQDAEAVRTMGGRLPYGAVRAEYPAGRGFLLKAVRAELTQVAIPYDEANDEIQEELDDWVERILKKHKKKTAQWRFQGDLAVLDPRASGGSDDLDLVELPDDWEEMSPEAKEEFRKMMAEMGVEVPGEAVESE